jgi:hypothetical protein
MGVSGAQAVVGGILANTIATTSKKSTPAIIILATLAGIMLNS